MNKPYEDHVSTVESHDENMTLKEAEEPSTTYMYMIIRKIMI